jgi:hypothetical protein
MIRIHHIAPQLLLLKVLRSEHHAVVPLNGIWDVVDRKAHASMYHSETEESGSNGQGQRPGYKNTY